MIKRNLHTYYIEDTQSNEDTKKEGNTQSNSNTTTIRKAKQSNDKNNYIINTIVNDR